MSDVMIGSIEFGVFALLTLAAFWFGRDREDDLDQVEMGSGRRVTPR